MQIVLEYNQIIQNFLSKKKIFEFLKISNI